MGNAILPNGERSPFAPKTRLVTKIERLHGHSPSDYRYHICCLEREIARLTKLLEERRQALGEITVVSKKIDQMRLELNELFMKFNLIRGRASGLSVAESRVYALFKKSREASNKEMASELGVSERTVKFHMSNIMAKVGVKSRRSL